MIFLQWIKWNYSHNNKRPMGHIAHLRTIFKRFQYNFTILLLHVSPLREGSAPSFEQTWVPSTNGLFVRSFVLDGTEVLEKNILKCLQNNFTVSLLSSLAEGHCSLFEQIWIPSTNGWFVPSLVSISQVGLEKMKMWKIYRQIDGQTTDNRWSENSLEVQAQVRWKS